MSGGHNFTTALPSFSFIYSLAGQKCDNVVAVASCSASLAHLIRNKYSPGYPCISSSCKHFWHVQTVLQVPLPCFSFLITTQKFGVIQDPGPPSPQQNDAVGWDLHLNGGYSMQRVKPLH